MPPGSLSTLAVMNPGPITAKKAASRNQTIFHPGRRARCGRVAGMSWAEGLQAMCKGELVGGADRGPGGPREQPDLTAISRQKAPKIRCRPRLSPATAECAPI